MFIKSRKFLLLCLVLVLCCVLTFGCGKKDSTDPEPEPEPEEPVAVEWVTYDWTDKVEAPTGWGEGNNDFKMETCCTIADGALVFNSTHPESSDGTGTPSYKLALEDVKEGFGMTMAIKVKANDNLGLNIDFRSAHRHQYDIKDTEWHTYYITYKVVADGVEAKIYIDGATTPTVDETVNKPDTSGYLRFGDPSGSKIYKSSIDWIYYTLDGAYAPSEAVQPDGFPLK